MKNVIYFAVFVVVLVGAYFVINGNLSNHDMVIDANNENISVRERESETFVYETEAESADECSAHEQFDAENRVCYFECANEAECAEIEKAIEEEFGGWTEELANDTGKVEEKTIAENDKSLQAEYKVSPGENITLESGKDNEKFRKIWSEIAELSPDSLSNTYIEKYQIFDNKSDDTLAFVDDEDGNGKWRVAVNLAGYNTSTERENKSTFIHELAHIITLNKQQINDNESDFSEGCGTFKIEEGCVWPDTYLNVFGNQFWKVEGKQLESQEFEEDKFVTEYASTNAVEDLAESFAFYVLSPKPTGNTIRDQKILSWYKLDPDNNLGTSFRSQMRNALSKDIVRARKLSN